ncbi:suppressor APC domain-containing protein 2 [Nilaparvata lugens]|uniref:suppressor APC domain-containing protein 2 n=1 Tax=Nilaparvata lugens TaxID=108931 RepID=UPI000B986362|nr:suppressor APC domain-containing protein 2 [Nilaparvata lugens]XP_039286494.1 suppressor APC domain-containing protein 2 [Nilaparvata lugens]XP_039286495.1 suppressor APC domain-containing protein 2 [Nilaparvata lugens]
MPPPTVADSAGGLNSALEGLPKQFVHAMRTLFDIMDDKGYGFVEFREIQNRWQDDGTKGLPKGVIESLGKVTPADGLLTFDRFCAGLKMCLLKNQTAPADYRAVASQPPPQPQRPPSAPLLDVDSTATAVANKQQRTLVNTAKVRPNNAMAQQRTLSMPQLVMAGGDSGVGIPIIKPQPQPQPMYSMGPPKPPRTAAGLERERERDHRTAEIRTALHNWQLGLMRLPPNRVSGDGLSAGHSDQANAVQAQQKKTNGRRREPRRHTLQNGIDYNMLKRMKQIEQEKEILQLGLQAVDRARDWYLKQMAAVHDKMKYLGRMGSHTEQLSEAQQERVELQRARVLEVNRHLATLTDGVPLHMNLALSAPPPHLITRLNQQNHFLNEELTKKSERITSLEREKATLIRELLQTRAQARRIEPSKDGNTFVSNI